MDGRRIIVAVFFGLLLDILLCGGFRKASRRRIHYNVLQRAPCGRRLALAVSRGGDEGFSIHCSVRQPTFVKEEVFILALATFNFKN